MLCLPEFDTYHILDKYARDPDDKRNRLALRVLKHRATLQLHWRSMNSRIGMPENLDTLFDLQVGREIKLPNTPKPVDFNNMSEDQMMDVYWKALHKVGLELDPETLAKAQQQ